MSSSLELHGVIPPVCTPRLPGGDLDRRSLTRLCQRLVQSGVHGLFIGGSTGEAALLDDATRLAALETAVGAAAGAVPVIYGVIDTGTRRVIERALPAVERGAAAIVATVPFYVTPDQHEILAHFALLRERLDVPVIAYDIPSATHVRLAPDTLIALARAGDICGAKDSSGDLAGMRWTLDNTRDLAFPILTGSETIADVALACGAAGVVPGLGNVDASGYVRLYDCVQSGDLAGAAEQQRRLSRLFRIVTVADQNRVGLTAAALGSFKSAMTHLGLIDHPDLWPPLGALTAPEHGHIAAVVDEHLA